MPAKPRTLFYAPGIPMPNLPAFDVMSAKAVIQDCDGQLLMQRKQGRLGLFGGNADKGESVLSALQRELWEEIEARVNPGDVRYLARTVQSSREGRKLTVYMFWQNTGHILTRCHEHKMENFASFDELMRRRRFDERARKAVQLSHDRGLLRPGAPGAAALLMALDI